MTTDMDLKAELIAALELLDDCEVVTSLSVDDIQEPDSDLPSREEKVTLYLPASHDREVEVTIEQVLEFARELRESTLVETRMLLGGSWAIVRVVGQNEKAEYFIQTASYHHAKERFFEHDINKIKLYLQWGINSLAINYAKLGVAEEFYPEFGNDEIFAFIKASPDLPLLTSENVTAIIEAYLFEIGRASGISLRMSDFPDINNEELPWMDDKARDSLSILAAMRLRPLLVGQGLDEVLALFNEACGLERHPDHLLLGFVRVLEHVSVTVVRHHAYQQVRARLLSERALDPDAAFIEDLQRLMTVLERKRNDKEAIKEAIRTCCDIVELARDAPPFLTVMKGLSSSSSAQVKEQAANTLAHALYATRNAVAHAKANYVATGQECPVKELSQFAEVARQAAAQAIRWLGTVDSRYRV